jgi:splicing factor 3A subunit 1
VARNGPEFESRILKNEQSNLKFSFLNPKDPFHPFYRSRVSELGGKSLPPEEPVAPTAGLSKPTTAKVMARAEPLEPPRQAYVVPRPVGVIPLDVDIIQLSAQ